MGQRFWRRRREASNRVAPRPKNRRPSVARLVEGLALQPLEEAGESVFAAPARSDPASPVGLVTGPEPLPLALEPEPLLLLLVPGGPMLLLASRSPQDPSALRDASSTVHVVAFPLETTAEHDARAADWRVTQHVASSLHAALPELEPLLPVPEPEPLPLPVRHRVHDVVVEPHGPPVPPSQL